VLFRSGPSAQDSPSTRWRAFLVRNAGDYRGINVARKPVGRICEKK
jgi:hypothetical protein